MFRSGFALRVEVKSTKTLMNFPPAKKKRKKSRKRPNIVQYLNSHQTNKSSLVSALQSQSRGPFNSLHFTFCKGLVMLALGPEP